MKKATMKALITGLVIFACVSAGLLVYNAYNTSLGGGGGGGTEVTFSCTIRDPLNPSITLDKSDFEATLYGLPIGDDPDNIANWDTISGVSDLQDITETKLDATTYERWFVGYNATIDQDTFDDELGDRTYYYRETELYPASANDLVSYIQPAGGAFIVSNMSSGSVIDISATNITTTTNFTIVNMVSDMSSEIYQKAAYVAYFSFTDWEWVNVNFIVGITGYSGSVKTGDLKATGLTVEKETIGSLKLSTDYLGVTAQVCPIRWGNDAIDDATEYIGAGTNITQYWGTTAI